MPTANVSFGRGPLSELFIDSWHWTVHFLGRASGAQPTQAKRPLLTSVPPAQNPECLVCLSNVHLPEFNYKSY